MNTDVVQSLVQSGDEDVREIAFLRILRRRKLDEEAKHLLRESIPSLPHDRLLELLDRHGDLGIPAVVVRRLIEEMPRDHAEQQGYFGSYLDLFARALDADAYADFVEKARPLVSSIVRSALVANLRGSPLFDAIVKRDLEWPPWMHYDLRAPLTESLIDVRYDERAIRERLDTRVAKAEVDDLLRLHWVLDAVGCADLAQAAWERALDGFAFPGPSATTEYERRVRCDHFLRIVSWVNEAAEDRPSRLGWLADRVMAFEREGASFAMLARYFREVPEELLKEVASVLIDRGEAPRWAGSVLRERLASGSLAAWNDFFTWWRPQEDVHRSLGFGDQYRERKAMVMTAPLPAEAPDTFDGELCRRAEQLMAYEQEQIACWRKIRGRQLPEEDEEAFGLEYAIENDPHLSHLTAPFRPLLTVPRLVERLLQMRLTPARAGRIARMLKGHPELIRDPRMAEVAALAGPVEPHALPALDEIEIHFSEQLALYRALGGAAADERLREHVRWQFEEMKRAAAEGERLDGRSFSWWWPWLPEIVGGDLRAEMIRWASEAPLDRTLDLHRQAPWLVDQAALEAAAQRHLDAGLPWALLAVPAVLLPFVETWARRTGDERELIAALEWLDRHESPRSTRLGIVLARFHHRPPTPRLTEAAARMLSTRSAWEDDGAVLVRAILRWNDWDALGLLWGSLWGVMMRVPDKNTEKLLGAVHFVLATAILELATTAADAGDEHRLAGALTALLKLDPPPPIVRELRKLRSCRSLSERAKTRVDAGMELFKSMAGRSPTLTALYEATSTLRSTFGAGNATST